MYLYQPPFFDGRTIFNKHFNPNGVYNGKNSWVSDDLTIKIIWDPTLTAWKLSGDSLGATQIINTNPAYPPINTDWKILGNGNTYTVKAVQGACPPIVQPFSYDYDYENPGCKCDGSINLTATGGVPPYQYSYDGGVTYISSPIKTGLCGGTYITSVKDSANTEGGEYTINLSEVKPITEYQIYVTEKSSKNITDTQIETEYVFVVSPKLPNGVTITVDLTVNDVFYRTPYSNSANSSLVPQIKKNGTLITNYTNNTTETTSISTQSRCQGNTIYNTNYSYKYPSITISSTDVYGSILPISIKTVSDYNLTCNNVPPVIPAYLPFSETELGPLTYGQKASANYCCNAGFLNRTSSDVVLLSNASIVGCDCCKVSILYLKSLYE